MAFGLVACERGGKSTSGKSSCTNNSVTLAWEASMLNDEPHPHVIGYTIHVGKESENYQGEVTMELDGEHQRELMHTVTGLVQGERYYFAVSAFAGDGRRSDYSNEVSTEHLKCAENKISQGGVEWDSAISGVDLQNTDSKTLSDAIERSSIEPKKKEILIRHFLDPNGQIRKEGMSSISL
jgi:hypothetical protein